MVFCLVGVGYGGLYVVELGLELVAVCGRGGGIEEKRFFFIIYGWLGFKVSLFGIIDVFLKSLS